MKMNIDYIRKDDAISAARHAWAKGLEPSQYIELITPADVVSACRCKDCKFYISMRPDIKTGICDLNVHHMGDDGFCSCGERREERA